MREEKLATANKTKCINGSAEQNISKNSDKKSKKSIKNDKPATGEQKPKRKGLSKLTIWTIKITIITFVLSGFFSYISEITTANAPIAVAFMLLILLLVINIIFDAIGVAATACELAPLLSMAARKVRGSKIAVKLVKNAEKVSNICGDVIGDICGIISGACAVAIVFKIIQKGDLQASSLWITIVFSSIIAALTVGGKAVFKEIAIKNSRELIMFVSRILSFFMPSAK